MGCGSSSKKEVILEDGVLPTQAEGGATGTMTEPAEPAEAMVKDAEPAAPALLPCQVPEDPQDPMEAIRESVSGAPGSSREAEDHARAAASRALAQCLEKAAQAAACDLSFRADREEDDVARTAACMAIAQCLQKAEVEAEDQNLVLEAQCVAAQHVESWTASILLLQEALAGIDFGNPREGLTHVEEAEEVADSGDEWAEGQPALAEFDLNPPEPLVTSEVCEPIEHEERPTTADAKDDLISTCDGSRRDVESRCDAEGAEFVRPGSSERPERSEPQGGADFQGLHSDRPTSQPKKLVVPLEEEDNCEAKVEKMLREVAPGRSGVSGLPASPCHVDEDEQADMKRLRKEAEKFVSEVEAKAQALLLEQDSRELQQAAEKLVEELEAKVKETRREKHAEQTASARIREEAERAVEKTQEKAPKETKLVHEVEAEARKALREQQERSTFVEQQRIEAQKDTPAVRSAEPDPDVTKLRLEAESLEAEIRASQSDETQKLEATNRALDAQFEALQKSEEHRLEALQALDATREVVRQVDMAYAKAELLETSKREAEERAKVQDKEIQDSRRRVMQEEALQKTEAERREAVRALETTRQVARKSNDDAKAKWEQMKAQAAATEREVREAAEAHNRRVEKAAQAPPSAPPKAPKVEPVKDELERVQAEADQLLATAQRAKALAEEEQERAQQCERDAQLAEAKAKTAQMEALKCREKLRRSQKEVDDAERARCEAVLSKIRWRVEARRLQVEEELFSQATLDAERPDQMDAFGAFPPVINHARNNLEFALRHVRGKMEAHGLRRVPPPGENCKEEEPQVKKPETFDQMLQRMRSTWDRRLKVLEGQGGAPGSPGPRLCL